MTININTIIILITVSITSRIISIRGNPAASAAQQGVNNNSNNINHM